MNSPKLRGLITATMLIAVSVIVTQLVPKACAAGACDVEDFYPSSYYHNKYSYDSNKKDLILSYYL